MAAIAVDKVVVAGAGTAAAVVVARELAVLREQMAKEPQEQVQRQVPELAPFAQEQRIRQRTLDQSEALKPRMDSIPLSDS